MKPEVTARFNGGDPVITIQMHGYLRPWEAIEHALEVIRVASGLAKVKPDPLTELYTKQRETIAHLQPVVDAAIAWQDDPSDEADAALHRALHEFEDRGKKRWFEDRSKT